MYYVHCANYYTLISKFIYDSEDYNDPDYEVSTNSEDSDNTSNNESNTVSQSFFNKSEKSNTSKSSLDTSKHNHEGIETCDDTNLIVFKSEKKGTNKKYFCKYCKTLQTKFARHLETVHKNEIEVKKFSLLPKGKYNP